MKRTVALFCCALMLAMNIAPVLAQTEFRKALQKKYDFKSVSCFTCHERVKLGTENPKQFRNEFGNAFHEQLKGKNVTARLAEVKPLAFDDPKKTKVKEEVTVIFLEVLKKVEKMKSKAGPTWGDLLKEGKIDGLKLK